jgi:hypothetical protein
MAVTHGPLFSLDARGSIANTLTYSKQRGQTYTKIWKAPANPQSPRQVGQRVAISFITKQWANLAAIDKATWEPLALQTHTTPYHAYLAFNARRWAAQLPPSTTPFTLLEYPVDLFYNYWSRTETGYQFDISFVTEPYTAHSIQICSLQELLSTPGRHNTILLATPTEDYEGDLAYLAMFDPDPWAEPPFVCRLNSTNGAPSEWFDLQEPA